MEFWAIFGLILICIFLIFMLLKLNLKNQILNQKLNFLEQNLNQKNTEFERAKIEYKNDLKNAEEKALKQQNESLNALEEKYKKTLKDLEQKLEFHYKAQNEAILNQNKIMLNEDTKKLLDEIFKPIKKSVDEYSKNLNENEIRQKTNIENLFKYSQKIEHEADKFAKILKNDKKIRGDFGELQLKNVLENSGLIEGEQYELQTNFTLENKKYRPDAIVWLDKDKKIVIDAKFSLPNLDFSQLEGADELAGIQIAKNLKARIDELANKPYNEFGYDFVLLFVPYQNILDLALSAEPGIYKYAYERKIFLTAPHTLFMALKTINITWQNIKSDANAKKALDEVSKFYDKFVGVLDDFEKLKRAILSLKNSAQEMDKKLINGSGNLANRFEKLKELGIKTNKNLTIKD